MTHQTRRQTLKSLVASVPAVWAAPLIQVVSLPAHGQTSPGDFEGAVYSGTGLSDVAANGDSQMGFVRLVDAVIPPARAQAGGMFYACAVCSESVASVAVAGLSNRDIADGVFMIRRGTLDLDGSIGMITAEGDDVSPCFDSDPGDLDRSARITSIDDTQIEIEVLTDCGEAEGSACEPGQFLNLSVPRSETCLPEPSVGTDCKNEGP